MRLRLALGWCLYLAWRLQGDGGAAAFANYKLGLFTHYTFAGGDYKYGWTHASPQLCKPVAGLNTLAGSFDANAFAQAARAMRAQYVIFTLFHASVNILYPSAYWERVLPGHTSRRDVIRDLMDALRKRNIRLVLYFHPVDGHDFTPGQQERTAWTKFRGGADTKPWNGLMLGLMDEVGARYGTGIGGYWLDGAPAPPKFDGTRFKAAIRKHNADAVVWVNYGLPTEKYPHNLRLFPGLSDLSVSENYQGMINGTVDTDQWVTDQNQVAVQVGGEWWAVCGKMRQTPGKMLRYTARLAGTLEQRNGGVAWAAGPFANNAWESGVREGFAELGRLLDPIAESIFETTPSVSYVTHAGTLQRDTWGVATDSRDGRFVYLHVLNPPAAHGELRIPRPADGRKFRSATLVANRKRISIRAEEAGYVLRLPEGVGWSHVDTVIRLEAAAGPLPPAHH